MYLKFAEDIRMNTFDLVDLILELVRNMWRSVLNCSLILLEFSSIDEPEDNRCRITTHLTSNNQILTFLVTVVFYLQLSQSWLD